MSVELFTGRRKAEQVFFPADYSKKVNFMPQIGDVIPTFKAMTTQGAIDFHDWAAGQWVFLFSHPAAFTPVCTTEMVSLSTAKADFDARGVKILGFTASSLEQQQLWHLDIQQKFGATVAFPTVDDHDSTLARTFGMMHVKEASAWPIRKSIILDPKMRIRMILEYPIYVGRSTHEVLRCIDALHAVYYHDVATPADWKPGDAYLCPESHGQQVWKLAPFPIVPTRR